MNEKTDKKNLRTYYKIEISKISDCDDPIIKLNIIDYMIFDLFNEFHFNDYDITIVGKFNK